MAAKTSVISQAKGKAPSLKVPKKSTSSTKLTAVKGVKSGIRSKYPRLSAATRSAGSSSKKKSSSASASSLKSLLSKLKKSGGASAAMASNPEKSYIPSPAFFGPLDPNTWK